MDYTYSTCLYDYRKFITADQYPQCTTEELNARHLKMYVQTYIKGEDMMMMLVSKFYLHAKIAFLAGLSRPWTLVLWVYCACLS